MAEVDFPEKILLALNGQKGPKIKFFLSFHKILSLSFAGSNLNKRR